jgi:hypothetical protein
MTTKRIENTTTGKRKILVCLVCGTRFSLPLCHARRTGVGKFCSMSCQTKHNKSLKKFRERTCVICGEIFYPRISQIRSGQGETCSVECRSLNQSGEKNGFWGKKHSKESIQKAIKTRTNNGTFLSGEEHHSWKGGYVSGDGYKVIQVSKKTMLEHRHIMEKHLGRKLSCEEIVHHLDCDTLNNAIGNLIVVTRSEHASIHAELARRSYV